MENTSNIDSIIAAGRKFTVSEVVVEDTKGSLFAQEYRGAPVATAYLMPGRIPIRMTGTTHTGIPDGSRIEFSFI